MSLKVHEAIDPELNFVLEKDLKKTIQDLKEKLKFGLKMSGRYFNAKDIEDTINGVFGIRLTKQRGDEK